MPEPAGGWGRLIGHRDVCALLPEALERIAGRTVLITGAGGYIGAAIARAAVRAGAQRVLLLDHAEAALYSVGRELMQAAPAETSVVLGNAADTQLLDALFEDAQPDIVFHAAAYKHVPLGERNPFSVIENNVGAALVVSRACAHHAGTQLVVLSTDKAVAPRSIMGASKRVGELLVIARRHGCVQRAVRLGNVLGSPGSVGPLFLEQLAAGSALTVTSQDARRYLLTLDQAVHALTGALAAAAEATLLIPFLGSPVRIEDLARTMIGGRKNGIVFTGPRPGDKAEEALLAPGETATQAVAGGLQRIDSPREGIAELEHHIDALLAAARRRELQPMLAALRALVPDYQPSALLAPGAR